MKARIKFCGAARTVTGSMHLLEVGGKRILLDCGLMQGPRKESFERNRNFPFNPSSIDVVILSHAHIDHSGNLPSLVRKGFDGRIISTSATRDLCAVMLRDSAHIQLRDVEYVNKRRRRQGKTPFEPLYTAPDVVKTLSLFGTVDYGRTFHVCNEVTATFYDAGHILGSASVLLSLDGGRIRFGFTGDIGRTAMPILRDPQILPEVNWLITECTYGNREQPAFEDMPAKLREIVSGTIERGGRVIIPAFSVGRTQNLVYSFHELFTRDLCKPVPIYVDSPLSVNATEVFKMHPECYDKETLELLEEDAALFGFGLVTYIHKVEDSKALNDRKEPCVIISASGMCEFGRVVHHVKNNIKDPRNTILIVGYQARHTLGKRLVDRHREVRIFGEPHKVRAQISVLNGYSAHADKNDLLTYLDKCASRAKGVFLVHGDEEAAFALQESLHRRQVGPVQVPELGQEVVID